MEKESDNLRVKKQYESALLPWEHICYLPTQLLQRQSLWHRGRGRSDLPLGKFNLSVEILRVGPGSWECPGNQLPCGNWERMKVSEIRCTELAGNAFSRDCSVLKNFCKLLQLPASLL